MSFLGSAVTRHLQVRKSTEDLHKEYLGTFLAVLLRLFEFISHKTQPDLPRMLGEIKC